MFIEVIGVEQLDPVKTKTGSKPKVEVTYTRDGKKQTRKLVGITSEQENVISVLSDAAPGQTFEVDLKKDGEYYNWVGIKESAEPPPQTGGYKAGGGKTFETPAERHNRQVLIVRQSSVTAALAYHNQNLEDVELPKLLKTAAQIEAWVFRGIASMDEPCKFATPPAAQAASKPAAEKKAPAAKESPKSDESFEDDLPWDSNE